MPDKWYVESHQTETYVTDGNRIVQGYRVYLTFPEYGVTDSVLVPDIDVDMISQKAEQMIDKLEKLNKLKR